MLAFYVKYFKSLEFFGHFSIFGQFWASLAIEAGVPVWFFAIINHMIGNQFKITF